MGAALEPERLARGVVIQEEVRQSRVFEGGNQFERDLYQIELSLRENLYHANTTHCVVFD